MIDRRFLLKLILGDVNIPDVLFGPHQILRPEGATLTTVVLGRPGSGKSTFFADYLVTLFDENPEQTIIFNDWSGGGAKKILKVALSKPHPEKRLEKYIYDDFGGRVVNGRKLIMPMPFFHRDYDPELPWETRVNTQVARVARSFEKLNYDLIKQNPTMGGLPLKEVLPEFLKLVNCIPMGRNGQSWQITEVKRLMSEATRPIARGKSKGKNERPNELWTAVEKYAGRLEGLYQYFTDDLKTETDTERKHLTRAPRNILTVFDADEIRARVGMDYPGYTSHEAATEHRFIIRDGSQYITRRSEQNYLFELMDSLDLAEINKRQPDDPNNSPFSSVYEDLFGYISNAAVSMELAQRPGNFRARNLRNYYLLQSLGQVSEGVDGQKGLKDVFWDIGNIVVFSLLNFHDAQEVAKQLFQFDPSMVKVPARTPTQHDIHTNRDEQSALWAARIQRFNQRECLVRRFLSEEKIDPRVKHIKQTPFVRITATDKDVEDAKDYLFAGRAVDMEYALEVIRKRSLISDDPEGEVRAPQLG